MTNPTISKESAVPQEKAPRSTSLRTGAIGVFGILFFVLSAQAPLTGIAGALPLTVLLGNGAGAPGAYLVIGIVIVIFAIGFIAMSRKIRANGAFYAYVSAGIGRRVGAGSAWLAILAYATVQAAMYGLYGASFSALLSEVGIHVPWWLPVLVTIAGIQLLGSLNIELGARVLVVLVAFEIAILLAFAFGVLFTGGGNHHGSIDLGASFAPSAIAAGAPGVAIMFAVASMFGFESTAIYSGEAKDPQKTVARATYLSVGVIAIFFSFVSWMFVSYYGASHVISEAAAALKSGDSTSFVFKALDGMLGPWAGTAANILLLTSLFAGILAFHNGINRYFHSLASQGSLPAIIARTNRHKAPSAAAWLQTIVAVLLVAPFALLGLDPVLTLFSWFSGVAVAALVLLYVLSSVAVIAYFAKHPVPGKSWQTRIAPALAAILLLGVLALIIGNFTSLIGGEMVTAVSLLISIPIVFVVAVILERPGRSIAPSDHEV